MKVSITIPTLKWNNKLDDYELKLGEVLWDSSKGTLSGDTAAVWYLDKCIKEALELRISYGLMPSNYEIKDPLREPCDLVAVLRYYGINVPNELIKYDISWFHGAISSFDDFEFYQTNPTKDEIERYESDKPLICY